MQYKIGVFGSAKDVKDDVIERAKHLGQVLAKHSCIVINGATTGLPFTVAKSAYDKGALIWGFSPTTNEEDQRTFTPEQDLDFYERLVYIPKDYEFADNDLICKKYRNVTSTATCDAGIVISGRWGTLNEFTNLSDMGKVIGVLTGTGGVADELRSLVDKVYKKTDSIIVFDDSPERLVERVLDELKKRNV